MKDVLEKIKEARENSKPRRFVQTWDLIINLKGIDLKKPENRFNFDVVLPSGRGKTTKVVIIADSMISEAKKLADLVITKEELEELGKDKKKAKKLAKEYDYFFGEAPLMPLIGRFLGPVLGPRGKMPKPFPPKADLKSIVDNARKSVRAVLKETPVISVPVGIETMKDEDIATNIEAVFNAIKERLPKGQNNIKSVMLKLTMGRPVKIKVM